ncbi:MAG: hypothetical protein ACXW5U_11970 [Thermoanaerobaculia bacterium]
MRQLEALSNLLNVDVVRALADGDRTAVTKPLEAVADSCRSVGLALSAKYASEIVQLVNETPSLRESLAVLARTHAAPSRESLAPAEFQREVEILRKRIDDELAEREFFVLDDRHRSYFHEVALFGSVVADAFPGAAYDIEEAGKCLALGRATAGVYHLMRVMERGLRATGKALGIPYAPSWESYLTQINARIHVKHRKKGVRWKRDEPFFKDVAAYLQTVKIAWRNPTMHVQRDYTPAQADEILAAVRGFMTHLASRLHE